MATNVSSSLLSTRFAAKAFSRNFINKTFRPSTTRKCTRSFMLAARYSVTTTPILLGSSSSTSLLDPLRPCYQSKQQQNQQNIRQQRQWFATSRRPRRQRTNKNKKQPSPTFFEVDEDKDDGEQWKKAFGEEGDEWEEVELDDARVLAGEEIEDDEETGNPPQRKSSSSSHFATNKESSGPSIPSYPQKQPHQVNLHSSNTRLSAVISSGWSDLNTLTKHIMTKTPKPLIVYEKYGRGRPSNEQLSMAYQIQELLQDYLEEIVNKRYDKTFCIPGTYSSIEIRAVETSPDLHLARVYWSLPSDCRLEMPDSLQVKLIHHMQDVVFAERGGKHRLQRKVHTQFRYLRNPPKISMVWYDDDIDSDIDDDDDDKDDVGSYDNINSMDNSVRDKSGLL